MTGQPDSAVACRNWVADVVHLNEECQLGPDDAGEAGKHRYRGQCSELGLTFEVVSCASKRVWLRGVGGLRDFL